MLLWVKHSSVDLRLAYRVWTDRHDGRTEDSIFTEMRGRFGQTDGR